MASVLKEAGLEQNSTDEEKHSAAMELKEKGNECFKKGRNHYKDAFDCHTRVINQKALTDADTSVIYSNCAQVNLLLGNYRRALKNAEEAIKLSPTNAKAVKASLSLHLLDEAKSFCDKSLEMSPVHEEELKKLAEQIDSLKLHHEQHGVEIANAVAAAKV